ncbi:hypothetical protein TEA_024086 [Camellia sinensis var. sinensis]|uniref:Uncharacterized protein n=1 Tax=Camellia sinensis var. sinensis TaxID=542762 RepID=A0A4S4EWU6_CAMSN|nr:hypothetical protein TEA_024086 [Camellia sinensis var. sinensis]
MTLVRHANLGESYSMRHLYACCTTSMVYDLWSMIYDLRSMAMDMGYSNDMIQISHSDCRSKSLRPAAWSFTLVAWFTPTVIHSGSSVAKSELTPITPVSFYFCGIVMSLVRDIRETREAPVLLKCCRTSTGYVPSTGTRTGTAARVSGTAKRGLIEGAGSNYWHHLSVRQWFSLQFLKIQLEDSLDGHKAVFSI